MRQASEGPRRRSQVHRVGAAILRSPHLRSLSLAFAGFKAAESGIWVALLVFAFQNGGATVAGAVAVAGLAPAALIAPWAAALADGGRPAHVLAAGYAGQAAALGAAAAAVVAGPPLLAYAVADVAATTFAVTRPAQAALTPSVAHTPEELTAANVTIGWIESAGMLVAPAAAGVLLALAGPDAVFGLMAALCLAAALLVSPITRAPVPIPLAGTLPSPSRRLVAGVADVVREPGMRLLLMLLGAQFIAIGALDLLAVVLAIQVLGLGGAGAGWLTAAFGGGGVLGIAATATVMVRSELMPAVLAGAVGWGAAFITLGLWPTTAGAFVLLVLAGASRTLVDVAGRTILQRVAPPDALARVFGVLEALAMAGLAIGALLVPPVVSVGGAPAAIIGVGAILPAIAIAAGPRLLAIDRREAVPLVELALLRTAPIFAALPPPTLVALARELRPVDVASGTALIRQGEPGDRYYLIANGEFDIVQDGQRIAVRGRGEGLGEIALLRGVPRTATVTARTDARLYALERAPFIAVVTGHPPSTHAADRLISQRLGTPADGQPAGPGPIGRS